MKKLRDSIELIAATLLIMLFLYAAVSKWLDMETFTQAMYNQPFPKWFARIIILTVPAIEIIISLLLMFKRTQHLGFAASFILMSLFTGYIATILLRLFPRVPCSCGGLIKKLGWTQHLVFNLFFVALSLAGIRANKKDWGATGNDYNEITA